MSNLEPETDAPVKTLEEIEKIVLMERHDGARKMADILIRCYVRHHLRLDV